MRRRLAIHAWESVQKTLNYIEENIKNEIQIEKLKDMWIPFKKRKNK